MVLTWLKNNWFKIIIILVLVGFGSVFLIQNQAKISNNGPVITEAPKELTMVPESANKVIVSSETINTQEIAAKTPVVTKPVPKTIPFQFDSSISLVNGINGWAFDGNKDYVIRLTFQNILEPSYYLTATSNSAKYKNYNDRQDGSFLWHDRPDVVSVLNKKGVMATSAKGFQFNLDGYADTDPSVPKGYYLLVKATYNGINIQLPKDSDSHLETVCGPNHIQWDCPGFEQYAPN